LKRLPTIIKKPPPVIFLSALGEDVDRIVGLEMGSDDYLVKPFHPRELLARIKSVSRRNSTSNLVDENTDLGRDIYIFAAIIFDETRRQLYKIPENNNLEIKDYIKNNIGESLNTIEFRLLKALVKNPQRVLSRDFLLDATIGREHTPTDRTIDVQMSRLRQRLGDDAKHSSLIRTVRYEGYMLNVKVEYQKIY